MDINTLKELATREEITLSITMKHNEKINYLMIVDGQAVMTTRNAPRKFRLDGAAELLKSIGINKFTVEN